MFSYEKSPKVSVIISVYNVKTYVAEALDSVINQTYKNLEIIVVDDGSNDGSENICDEYAKKDERIKLIHQENRGLSAARNTGLNNMTGEYVAFLDSDDAFLSETIEKSLDAMLANDVDCVIFKRINCKTSSTGKLITISKDLVLPKIPQGTYLKKEALIAVADKKINFAVWNRLYKQHIWNNLRFPEGKVYEDFYICFQIFNKTNKIYVMNEIFVKHRIRTGSITNMLSYKNGKDLFEARNIFFDFITSNTPEIFDAGQIQRTMKKEFNLCVLSYARTLSSHSIEKKEVLNLIKENIDNYEKTVNINDCAIEIKVIYFLMFKYPKLLSIFFMPCFEIYRFIKRIIKV